MYIPTPMRTKGKMICPIRGILEATRGRFTRWYAAIHHTAVIAIKIVASAAIWFAALYFANNGV
jgi:hypothetical protein